jgi:hypothetical protein
MVEDARPGVTLKILLIGELNLSLRRTNDHALFPAFCNSAPAGSGVRRRAHDFSDPNFLITFRMADINIGPSRLYYSLDPGKSWQGPYRVPDFGQLR